MMAHEALALLLNPQAVGSWTKGNPKQEIERTGGLQKIEWDQACYKKGTESP